MLTYSNKITDECVESLVKTILKLKELKRCCLVFRGYILKNTMLKCIISNKITNMGVKTINEYLSQHQKFDDIYLDFER